MQQLFFYPVIALNNVITAGHRLHQRFHCGIRQLVIQVHGVDPAFMVAQTVVNHLVGGKSVENMGQDMALALQSGSKIICRLPSHLPVLMMQISQYLFLDTLFLTTTQATEDFIKEGVPGASPHRGIFKQQGLLEFRKLMRQVAAHRMALVGENAGVFYYDDSKATNTGAVLSALENFAGNVILIAGGRDKGDDYTLLRESVGRKVRCLILIGEATELIAQALAGVTEVRKAGSMEEAVMLAAAIAGAGDTVLLSPACASFDMFENYGHRGKVFADAVQKVIAHVEPVVCKAGGI